MIKKNTLFCVYLAFYLHIWLAMTSIPSALWTDKGVTNPSKRIKDSGKLPCGY